MSEYPNIWTKSECISEVQLLGYIRGTLDAHEIRLIESHLNDCDLCSDAIDALLEEDANQTQVHLNELKLRWQENITRLQPTMSVTTNPEKTGHSTNSLTAKKFFRWMAAASILAFVSLGGYSVYNYIQSQQAQLAHKQPALEILVPKPPVTKQQDSIISDPPITKKTEATASVGTPASAPTPTAKTYLPEEKTVIQERQLVEDASSAPLDDVQRAVEKASPVGVQKEIPSTATSVDQVKALELDESPGMKNYAEERVAVGKVNQSAPIRKKTSVVGLSNKSNSNQPTNNTFLETPYRNTESNPFDEGMSLYQSGAYAKSISFFELALKKAAPSERDAIRYQLGLAYAKAGRSRKAGAIFEQLLENPQFAAQAEEQLKMISR